MTPRFFPLILGMLFFIASCSNDDGTVQTPPSVNQKPTISFVSPEGIANEGSAQWNTITVELNAKDNDGAITKVELFVNGTKVADLAEAPFTFQWNTKTVEDGITTLKAVATDDTGETGETEIDINVLNVLLDYNLFEGYLNTGDNAINYTYITGPAPDKQILYLSEITESSFSGIAQRPETYNGETFDVHFLEFVKGDMSSGEITTYHNVSPGTFHPFPTTPTDNGSELGEANVTLTNVPNHDYAMVFSGSNTDPVPEGEERSFTVFENNNLGYVYLQVGDAGFYAAVPFGVGDHELPLNEMNPSMQSVTFSDSAVSNNTVNYLVRGHLAQGRFSPAVTIFRDDAFLGGDAYEIKFHAPLEADAVFDHYFTSALLSDENGKTFIHQSYTDILTSMTKMESTLQATNRKLSELDVTATTTDDFDFIFTRATVAASPTFSFVWRSYSETDTITFPPIPTAVFEKTNGVFNASDIAFKDAAIQLRIENRDNYNGYPAFLDVASGRQVPPERTERTYVSQFFD